MAKLFQIRFDARTNEIETAYKAFQTRFTLKKRILYTVVYGIVIVLGVDLILKNPTGLPGYIATGLAAGILLFNWIKPLTVRKKLVQTLSELNDETYIASFFDDRIEIETVVEKTPEEQTETVAISNTGIYKVEEGSEAAKELAQHPAEQEEIPKTVYPLAETELCFEEKDGLLFLFVNRSYIHTIPLRCLSDEETERVRAYFSEKGLA